MLDRALAEPFDSPDYLVGPIWGAVRARASPARASRAAVRWRVVAAEMDDSPA
jgi:hypothetical protein